MAFEVINSTTVRRESNLRVERMEICVDAASDLPDVDGITGCKIAQGSIAWDVSTGDFYGMKSDGTWANQSGGGTNTAQTLEMTSGAFPVAAVADGEVEDDDIMGDFESTETGVQ